MNFASCPNQADVRVASRVARISPIGRCLEQALENLISESAEDDNTEENDGTVRENLTVLEEESQSNQDECCTRGSKRRRSLTLGFSEHEEDTENDKQSNFNDEDGPRTESSTKKTSTKSLRMDSKMSKSIMKSFDDAVGEYPWHNKSRYIKSGKNNSLPPAGLMRGKIRNYNRFGGQWRIVVSNAEIRPRVNLSAEQHSKVNKKKLSLWERSEERAESCETIHLGGDVQILAYDDD